MTDEKILKLLRKNYKQLFSAKEISDIIGEPIEKVSKRMKQLIKYDLLKKEKINRMVASKIYGKNYKRGVTLYFYESSL